MIASRPVVPLGRPPAPVASARALPCVHEGGVVEPCKGCNGEARHVRECDRHGRCTRGDAGKGVAVCQTCADYRPDPALLPTAAAYYGDDLGPLPPFIPGPHGPIPIPLPRREGVVIPPAPPLGLRPFRRSAVVTVAAGRAGHDLLAVTGPPMERFADRIGADFIVLDWPGHPTWPMSAKFAIPRALDHYSRILYADADVLFRPGCVNPLDLCGPDEMGVVDELHFHRANPRFRREAEYLALRRQMGFSERPHLPWYFNAGVMVVPSSHRELLEPPAGPIPPSHCAEQDHTNARLLDSGLPYRLMDRRANWQHWTDLGFRAAPPDAVLHWSGAGNNPAKRVADIRAALERATS